MKPTFASRYIIFGRVKASDRKITSGWRPRTSAISHSQKGSGLVCGLSTRKMRTPSLDPEQHDVAQRLPQAGHGAFGVEVDVDDVLVLLRRVLGVFDRAVGPPAEPVGVLAAARDDRASTGWRNRARSPGHGRAAAAISRRKSSNVPSAGWIASWPPSRPPIA